MTNTTALEYRFKRFLHYGSENATYKAEERSPMNYCIAKNVPFLIPSLIKLIEQKSESIIDIITKVATEKTSLWPDSVIFALAYCTHQEVSTAICEQAYKILRLVCYTSRDLILFVKFHRKLRGSKGGGNGFKRALAQWYLVWLPFDLADILLNQRSWHGWTHSDVLRIAHVRPISIEQQLLLTYASKGVEEAKTRFGEVPNDQVQELLEYITQVESFKRIKDPVKAAKAIHVELHNIERVPTKLFKHQEIWNELLVHMDVKTLLDNLHRLSILGFLKHNNLTVLRVLDILNNVQKAKDFPGHPSRVYIELMVYEKSAKHCLDIAHKMNHPISMLNPHKKPPKCNVAIKSALLTFFYGLHKFQKPTGLRYFVGVDVQPKMFTDRCHHSSFLSPIDAVSAICLSLIRTEPDGNVTIGTFKESNDRMDILDFNKTTEINTLETAFREKKPGSVSVAAAIYWAETNQQPVDVFLILSNFMIGTTGTRAAICNYRLKMNLPNTKVVTCTLSGNISTHKDVEGPNMLHIIGFDDKVCRLIEEFSKGSF